MRWRSSFTGQGEHFPHLHVQKTCLNLTDVRSATDASCSAVVLKRFTSFPHGREKYFHSSSKQNSDRKAELQLYLCNKLIHNESFLFKTAELWRGVVCSTAAGEADAPERHPQSRLAGLKQKELGPVVVVDDVRRLQPRV